MTIRFGFSLTGRGVLAGREAITTLAQRADALGYDSVFVTDRMLIPVASTAAYPYSSTGAFPLGPDEPWLESLTAVTYLVTVTRRVRVGTSVLVIPYRNPVFTARALATADYLSGGRVILGAGIGWCDRSSRPWACRSRTGPPAPSRRSSSCARSGPSPASRSRAATGRSARPGACGRIRGSRLTSRSGSAGTATPRSGASWTWRTAGTRSGSVPPSRSIRRARGESPTARGPRGHGRARPGRHRHRLQGALRLPRGRGA
jgi:hypothetical protein